MRSSMARSLAASLTDVKYVLVDGGTRQAKAVMAKRGHRPNGPTTDFNPFDPAVLDDPYPAYRQLLAGPAVVYNPNIDLWVISHRDAVRQALRDHHILSSAESVTRVRQRIPMMLTVDDPDHARMRPVFARIFTPKAIIDQRAIVERIVSTGLDRIACGDDAVGALAIPLPVSVIAEMLGVPARDFHRFRRWSDRIVTGFEMQSIGSLRVIPQTLVAVARMRGLISSELRRPRGQDLLNSLQAAIRAGQLAEQEAFWFALLLLVAGNETTTNLLGTLLHALAVHPDQYRMLRDNPALIGTAVEEALRWIAPIQGFHRTALGNYGPIPRGARVLLLFAAANRDPRHYERPDNFEITRAVSDHLSFGCGIHFCLGAHLARLEARILLEQLVQSAEHIEELAAPQWSRNPTLRGPTSLKLRLHPRYSIRDDKP